MPDLTMLAPAALNRLARVRLIARDIPFAVHQRCRLDIYRPATDGRFPVALFIYGGGWRSGCKELYRFVGAAFATSGFLTVIPDYRIYPEVRFPRFLEDCAAAISWVRREATKYGGDGAPPIVIGHSAGAYNAVMLALDPSWLGQIGLDHARDLGAVVGLAGPYDFLPIRDPTLRIVFGPEREWPRTQPIRYARGDNPPMLLLAGSADRVVHPGNTERLAARIGGAGGPVEQRIYRWIGHNGVLGAVAPQLRLLAPTLRDCLRFLELRRVAPLAAPHPRERTIEAA